MGLIIAQGITSPLQRARRTCELAGFAAGARVDHELVGWDYGRYEGLKNADIHKERPDLELFRDECPGGESPAEIAALADRVIARLRATPRGRAAVLQRPFLRVLAARWDGLDAAVGRHLFPDTAALSVLGYEHNPSRPVIRLWNDTRHVSE